MSIPRPKQAIDEEEVAALYLEDELEIPEIARRLGYTRRTVRDALRRARVRLRGPIPRKGKDRPIYVAWKRMRDRRRKAGGKDRRYSICAEWDSYRNFHRWAVGAGHAPGLCFVRIDEKRGFRPENCLWVPLREVRRRQRPGISTERSTMFLTAFGVTKSIKEWLADPRCVVTRTSVLRRLAQGYSPREALSLPRGTAQRLRGRKALDWIELWKRLSGIDWDRVERLYVKDGWSKPRIAEALRVSPKEIHNGLLRLGVRRRPVKSLTSTTKGQLLYTIWDGTHARCSNPKNLSYRYCGARGIRVCREWKEFEPFYRWAIEKGWRPGLCLLRVDKKRGYSPGNCRFGSRDETPILAGYRRPRGPVWTVEAFGERKGPTEWSRDPRCSMSDTALIARLRAGWPAERAITEPPRYWSPGRAGTVTAFGRTMSLRDWSRDRRCKVAPPTLWQRLGRGMSPEDAIATPPFGAKAWSSKRRRSGSGRRSRVAGTLPEDLLRIGEHRARMGAPPIHRGDEPWS